MNNQSHKKKDKKILLLIHSPYWKYKVKSSAWHWGYSTTQFILY